MSDDVFGGDSLPTVSWKDAPKGKTVTVTVTSRPEVVEGTEFDGVTPQKKIVFNGYVAENDDEEMAVWMPQYSRLAFVLKQAQLEAGALIDEGGVVTITTLGLVPSPKRKGSEFRDFTATYKQPAPKDAFAPADDEPPF